MNNEEEEAAVDLAKEEEETEEKNDETGVLYQIQKDTIYDYIVDGQKYQVLWDENKSVYTKFNMDDIQTLKEFKDASRKQGEKELDTDAAREYFLKIEEDRKTKIAANKKIEESKEIQLQRRDEGKVIVHKET
jgi:hypothetical protein